jgi:hypothetical protein
VGLLRQAGGQGESLIPCAGVLLLREVDHRLDSQSDWSLIDRLSSKPHRGALREALPESVRRDRRAAGSGRKVLRVVGFRRRLMPTCAPCRVSGMVGNPPFRGPASLWE